MEIKNEFGEEMKSMILRDSSLYERCEIRYKKRRKLYKWRDLDEEEKERKKEGEIKAGNEGTSG